MNPSTDPFVLSSLETETLLFREVVYPDGCEMPPHEHEIDCVVLMLQGTMTGTLGREKYEAGNSGLLFMPAWLPHSTRTYGGVRTFDVVFSPGYSDQHRQFLPRGGNAGNVGPVASRMREELQQPDRSTPLILSGLTLELLGWMSRAGVRDRRRPRWLATALEFIHAHLDAAVSLDDVARAASVHPAHLTRVFRAQLGCTIGEYSRRLRLDRACAALTRDDAPLAEIAYAAGFSDQSHFSRAFKAYTGMTPGQYRSMQLPSNGMQLRR